MGARRPEHHRLTSRRGGLAAAVLVALTLVGGPLAGPAYADDPDYYGGTNGAGDGLDLGGSDGGTGATPGSGSGSGTPASGGGDASTPQPWWETRYTPNCSTNRVDTGADALCGSAVNTCPGPGEIRYQEHRRLVQVDGSRGPWQFVGTVCRGPGEPVGIVQPEVTADMVVDAAQSLAPESTFVVEPGTDSFVNFPTNVAADRGGATETVFVLGQPIEVTFEPTDHAWAFGDGATASGVGIAGAEVGQAGAVEHEYRQAGDYEIVLTRTFTASFQLPDGEQVTVPGEISTTSDPYLLAVGEIQSLVTGVR